MLDNLLVIVIVRTNGTLLVTLKKKFRRVIYIGVVKLGRGPYSNCKSRLKKIMSKESHY